MTDIEPAETVQEETESPAPGTDEWLHAFAKKLTAENGGEKSHFEQFLEALPQAREQRARETERRYLDQITGEHKYQIGEAIRNRRRQLGLRQSQIAEKLGVTSALVSQWENGKTRVLVAALEPLAQVLQTSQAHLIGDERFPPPSNNGDPTGQEDRLRKLLLSIYDGMSRSDRELVLQAALAIASRNPSSTR